MHDPKTVAIDIPRPWPQRSRHDDAKPGQPRWSVRYGWAKWWDVRPRTFKAFSVLAGRGWYWPNLMTVWHNEPGGRDSGEVCKHHIRWQDDNGDWHSKAKRTWRWHVHHWSIQFHPWQHFRRWALTRCEWCGGPSRKGHVVNHSHQWGRDKDQWWRGERGLFHRDCSTIQRAHKTCTCSIGPWENGAGGTPYGKCEFCGRFRAWSKEPRDTTPERILQTIPEGQRDPVKYAQAIEWWESA